MQIQSFYWGSLGGCQKAWPKNAWNWS